MKIWIPTAFMLLSMTSCSPSEMERVQSMVNEEPAVQTERAEAKKVLTQPDRVAVPIEDVPATLFLQPGGNDEARHIVELQFDRQPTSEGPRALELFLNYPAEWAYEKSDALPAVVQANKRLIVQEKEPGILRVIVFASTNLDRIDSGGLAAFHFDTNNKEGNVSIRNQMPVFAPVETNEGLVLGEMLRVTP